MIDRVVVAGLAATRLVRAWRHETIGERPREMLLDWLDRPVMRQTVAGQSRATDEVNVKATAAKEWAAELVECSHCLGTWIAIGCVVGLANRRTRPVVQGLAAAMILSAIVDLVPGFEPAPELVPVE